MQTGEISSEFVFESGPLLEAGFFSGQTGFSVRTGDFLGPIDLLLHLVKKNELEIEKISLALVADQYVACLEGMRSYDLEIAGEYLVIAATLLSIKSSVLLHEPVDLELDEDGNLSDPHEELLARLKEAAIYLEGAELLAARPMLERDVFAPISKVGELPTPPDTYRDHDPYLLGLAFKKLLDKSSDAELRYQITLDSVSIVEQMMSVLDYLKSTKSFQTFEALVKNAVFSKGLGSEGKEPPRAYIVGTFIALLELCKRQVIRVLQEGDDIKVALHGEEPGELNAASNGLESEFDDNMYGSDLTSADAANS